ncbi:rhodanese-like domain-containing protein [Variovorax sp. CCNWLW235]|uniref:rhodanese-like domain-containing protein n=1 Tax=Variovorax sp. CCNWLW235 TaxID=3127463 RepID=UPI0030773D9D
MDTTLPDASHALSAPVPLQLSPFDPMLLHELYFASLGGNSEPMEPAMALALMANFGSVERWREEFAAMGKAHGGGSGVDVDTFMENIHWARVYERYQQAVHAASEPFGATHDEVAGSTLLDVRRAGVFEQATAMIPGATWRDPSAVDRWASELPAGRGVVVYCVYGHEVGRSTAMRLRAMGLDARYLRGGLDGWQAAGRPVEAKLPTQSL